MAVKIQKSESVREARTQTGVCSCIYIIYDPHVGRASKKTKKKDNRVHDVHIHNIYMPF
jgi:hypothetical protein